MRSKFDEQLLILNKEMIEMGAFCEKAIGLTVEAMSKGDMLLSEKVRLISEEIDDMENTIETRCLRLLLQQQPVARDLRQISAALKMITDMERIGDQAEDIADIIIDLKGRTANEIIHIKEMGIETIKMVTDSVDAYVKQDIDLATDVLKHDDIVDNYFIEIKQKLIEMIVKNSNDGEYPLDLLMIAKYFERIGDHATNIAEWVIFSVTGLHKGE